MIASVGDSLTSATAANSRAIWEVMVENRGLSWCIGGQGNWRTHLTLPNILKEFNPNVREIKFKAKAFGSATFNTIFNFF